jgi:hypothetical protein
MLSLQSMIVAAAVAGALLAYAAYGKFKKSRCSDLRSEVSEERASLRSVIEALPARLELAKQSPEGSAESIRARLSELEVDLLEAKLLGVELPDIDYAELSAGELELRLCEILALSMRANALAEKYGVTCADADDAEPADELASPENAELALAARHAHPAMLLAAPSSIN